MLEVRLIGSRGLILQALVPETRRERMRGLVGRSSLVANEALLLEQTRSIHTFGMRLPVWVVSLDVDLVARAARRVPPGRILLPRPGVRHVLECAEGADIRRGDRLRIVQAD